MTQVKLSRTSRSPTEPLLAVKSTMENESRQAHENNGFIFKPFTSHQIICCIFLTFSHHHSYLPLARDHWYWPPLTHEDTDNLRNICGWRTRCSGPKMGPNNNTLLKYQLVFFVRVVSGAAGGSQLFSCVGSSHNWITSHLWLSHELTVSSSRATQQNVRGVQPIHDHDHNGLGMFV